MPSARGQKKNFSKVFSFTYNEILNHTQQYSASSVTFFFNKKVSKNILSFSLPKTNLLLKNGAQVPLLRSIKKHNK